MNKTDPKFEDILKRFQKEIPALDLRELDEPLMQLITKLYSITTNVFGRVFAEDCTRMICTMYGKSLEETVPPEILAKSSTDEGVRSIVSLVMVDAVEQVLCVAERKQPPTYNIWDVKGAESVPVPEGDTSKKWTN